MERESKSIVKIRIDTTDVDEAIKKIEKLNELLKETRELLPSKDEISV